MSATGKHRLNNFDWYEAFGCYFDKDSGIESFWDFAELKEPFSHDWQDEDGKEYDLTDLHYQDAQITVNGTMTARSVAELNTRRDTLRSILLSDGEKTWYVKEMARNFQFFYRKMAFKRLTRVDNTVGKIGFTFQLTIQLLSTNDDDVPTYPDQYMLTQTIATHAAMIAKGVPAVPIRYKVAVDETNDNATNVLYEWWPDGTLQMVPSSTGAYFLQFPVASHAAMMPKATGTTNKIFFVAADEVNTDEYGQLNKPGMYIYMNGTLNKIVQKLDH